MQSQHSLRLYSLGMHYSLSQAAWVIIDDVLVFNKLAAEHKLRLDAVMAVIYENKILARSQTRVQSVCVCLGGIGLFGSYRLSREHQT